MKSNSFVSVVILANNGNVLDDSCIQNIQRILDHHYSDYEIVIISQYHDCRERVERILRDVPSIRLIQLAARVSDDVAWAAGVENAIGDFVVLFDHTTAPVAVIPELVDKCRQGSDVVIGVADTTRTVGYRCFRHLFRRALSSIGYNLPPNATSLRCLSRRAVNSVTRTGRYHHQFFMRIQKTGYESTALAYENINKSTGKKNLFDGGRDFLRLMVFNSTRPLRWISGVGFTGSFLAFLFAMYSLLIHFIKGSVVEGWTSTICIISSLFMTQFVILGFFGEYLARLLDDRSEQSDYSVVFEKNSLVMVNEDRVNVLNNALDHETNKVQTGRDR